MDSRDNLHDQLMDAFKVINKGMDAHLIESIISLFNKGILKHYIVEPHVRHRRTLNQDNFHLSVEAANGVQFEGQQVIIEMEKEIEQLKADNSSLKEALASFEILGTDNCHQCESVPMGGAYNRITLFYKPSEHLLHK